MLLFGTENKEGQSKWSLHDTWRLPGQIGVNKNQLNNWQLLGTGPKGWWWSRQRKRLEVFQFRQSVLRRGTLGQRTDGRETPRWGTTSLGLTANTKHALLWIASRRILLGKVRCRSGFHCSEILMEPRKPYKRRFHNRLGRDILCHWHKKADWSEWLNRSTLCSARHFPYVQHFPARPNLLHRQRKPCRCSKPYAEAESEHQRQLLLSDIFDWGGGYIFSTAGALVVITV